MIADPPGLALVAPDRTDRTPLPFTPMDLSLCSTVDGIRGGPRPDQGPWIRPWIMLFSECWAYVWGTYLWDVIISPKKATYAYRSDTFHEPINLDGRIMDLRFRTFLAEAPSVINHIGAYIAFHKGQLRGKKRFPL
jgi:hypothetical protein